MPNLEDDLIEVAPEETPRKEGTRGGVREAPPEDKPPRGGRLTQGRGRGLRRRNLLDEPPWYTSVGLVIVVIAATVLFSFTLLDEMQYWRGNSTSRISPCNRYNPNGPRGCNLAAITLAVCAYLLVCIYAIRRPLMGFGRFFVRAVRRQVEERSDQLPMEMDEIPPAEEDPPPVDPEEQPEVNIGNPLLEEQEEGRER